METYEITQEDVERAEAGSEGWFKQLASKKPLIHNIRFGHFDLRVLGDKALEDLMGYNMSHDVLDLCFQEAKRRRGVRLAEKRR